MCTQYKKGGYFLHLEQWTHLEKKEEKFAASDLFLLLIGTTVPYNYAKDRLVAWINHGVMFCLNSVLEDTQTHTHARTHAHTHTHTHIYILCEQCFYPCLAIWNNPLKKAAVHKIWGLFKANFLFFDFFPIILVSFLMFLAKNSFFLFSAVLILPWFFFLFKGTAQEVATLLKEPGVRIDCLDQVVQHSKSNRFYLLIFSLSAGDDWHVSTLRGGQEKIIIKRIYVAPTYHTVRAQDALQ